MDILNQVEAMNKHKESGAWQALRLQNCEFPPYMVNEMLSNMPPPNRDESSTYNKKRKCDEGEPIPKADGALICELEQLRLEKADWQKDKALIRELEQLRLEKADWQKDKAELEQLRYERLQWEELAIKERHAKNRIAEKLLLLETAYAQAQTDMFGLQTRNATLKNQKRQLEHQVAHLTEKLQHYKDRLHRERRMCADFAQEKWRHRARLVRIDNELNFLRTEAIRLLNLWGQDGLQLNQDDYTMFLRRVALLFERLVGNNMPSEPEVTQEDPVEDAGTYGEPEHDDEDLGSDVEEPSDASDEDN